MEEPVYIYVVGTAGSGKSRFTAGLKRWFYEHGLDAVAVNLDPGAESLPYEPDVDIRDWVILGDVMQQYQLGPNGAQVMAADLIALHAGELKDVLETYRPKYVIVDTPGQTELFVFRESGRVVMELLSRDRAMITFLVDPFLAKRASAFVAQLMLAATTQFRFQVPSVNVLTKTDLLKDGEAERILAWGEEPDSLEDALIQEKTDLYNQLSTDVFKVLEGLGSFTRLTPVSSESLEGMEDVYTAVQDVFAGSEDEEPS